MLENPVLWFEPVLPGVGLTAPRCSLNVRAWDRGPPIGRIEIRPLAWLPWGVRWRMAADEGADRSLVFTARRAGWMPRDWDVLDADGRFVALWRGSRLLRPDGRIIGRRSRGSAGQQPWAAWYCEASRLRLEFQPQIDEPFLRMAIIVASLIEPTATA